LFHFSFSLQNDSTYEGKTQLPLSYITAVSFHLIQKKKNALQSICCAFCLKQTDKKRIALNAKRFRFDCL